MMSNLNKMNELMNNTEELIATLETLNNEIESYKLAKDNLVEVKEKLNQFVDSAFEANASMATYIKELHLLVNSQVGDKIDSIYKQTDLIQNEIDKIHQISSSHEANLFKNQKMIKLSIIIGGVNSAIVFILLVLSLV